MRLRAKRDFCRSPDSHVGTDLQFGRRSVPDRLSLHVGSGSGCDLQLFLPRVRRVLRDGRARGEAVLQHSRRSERGREGELFVAGGATERSLAAGPEAGSGKRGGEALGRAWPHGAVEENDADQQLAEVPVRDGARRASVSRRSSCGSTGSSCLRVARAVSLAKSCVPWSFRSGWTSASFARRKCGRR